MDEETALELGRAISKLTRLVEGVSAKEYPSPAPMPELPPINVTMPATMLVDVSPMAKPMADAGKAMSEAVSGLAQEIKAALALASGVDTAGIVGAIEVLARAIPEASDYSAKMDRIAKALEGMVEAQKAHTQAILEPVKVVTDASGKITSIGAVN